MTAATTERVLSDKLCECGCGQRTYVADSTWSRKGWVKGEPYRFVQGHGWAARDLVPVAPFQEAFEHSGLTPAEVAQRLGWRDRRRADGPRVKRVLGLKHYWSHGGRRQATRRFVTYEMGLRLARALNVDPYEVGL